MLLSRALRILRIIHVSCRRLRALLTRKVITNRFVALLELESLCAVYTTVCAGGIPTFNSQSPVSTPTPSPTASSTPSSVQTVTGNAGSPTTAPVTLVTVTVAPSPTTTGAGSSLQVDYLLGAVVLAAVVLEL